MEKVGREGTMQVNAKMVPDGEILLFDFFGKSENEQFFGFGNDIYALIKKQPKMENILSKPLYK